MIQIIFFLWMKSGRKGNLTGIYTIYPMKLIYLSFVIARPYQLPASWLPQVSWLQCCGTSGSTTTPPTPTTTLPSTCCTPAPSYSLWLTCCWPRSAGSSIWNTDTQLLTKWLMEKRWFYNWNRLYKLFFILSNLQSLKQTAKIEQ